jgi:hypothetical protein
VLLGSFGRAKSVVLVLPGIAGLGQYRLTLLDWLALEVAIVDGWTGNPYTGIDRISPARSLGRRSAGQKKPPVRGRGHRTAHASDPSLGAPRRICYFSISANGARRARYNSGDQCDDGLD